MPIIVAPTKPCPPGCRRDKNGRCRPVFSCGDDEDDEGTGIPICQDDAEGSSIPCCCDDLDGTADPKDEEEQGETETEDPKPVNEGESGEENSPDDESKLEL